MSNDDIQSDANGISINGKTFPDSFMGACEALCQNPETVSLPLDLGRKYRTLKGRFGISDGSPTPGEPATIELIADGNVIYDRAFSLGQSQDVTLNVSGVLRLTVQFTGPLQDVYPAIGEPTVYS